MPWRTATASMRVGDAPLSVWVGVEQVMAAEAARLGIRRAASDPAAERSSLSVTVQVQIALS